jgi:general stress protein 26
MAKVLNHQERIKDELIKAGVTKYGLMKMEGRFAHLHIGEDEHVKGVVYGQGGSGSAMLIATDKRVVYLDQKPFFSVSDHLGYEAISGVEISQTIGFAHVLLHSRAGDYNIRFANINCARKFVEYIDYHQNNLMPDHQGYARKKIKPILSSKSADSASKKINYMNLNDSALDQDSFDFLRERELGVLATINRNNALHASAVYYTINGKGILHMVTKSDTNKAKDILSQQLVAMAVYDEETLETVQLEARAEVETDAKAVNEAYSQITRLRKHGSETKRPPVVNMDKGEFIVIRITPVLAKYTKF